MFRIIKKINEMKMLNMSKVINNPADIKNHSIIKNVFYNSLLNIFNILFPLIMLMYVSRRIGPENIGKVNWAITFTSYFALISVFGINNYGMRSIAGAREDKNKLDVTFSTIFSFSLVTSILALIAYIITIIAIPSIAKNIELFAITGIMVALSPLSLEWFFLGIENFKYIALRSMIIKTCSLIFMVIAIKNSNDYLFYALIYVLGLCLNYIFNFAYAMKIVRLKIKINKESLVSVFRSIYHFALITFVTSLYGGMDKILLGAISGFTSVGFYTPADKIVRTILSVIVAASTTMVPRTSFMIATGKKKEAESLIADSLHTVLLLAIPLFFGVLILAKPIILIFGGSAFFPSVKTLQIMAFIIVPVTLANVAGMQVLIACKYEKKYLISLVVGTIAFFVSALLTIKKYAQNGTAFSIVVAESVGAALEVYYARKYFRFVFKKKWVLSILASTIIMVMAILLILLVVKNPLISVLLCGTSGIVIYLAALYLMKDSIIIRLINKFNSAIS